MTKNQVVRLLELNNLSHERVLTPLESLQWDKLSTKLDNWENSYKYIGQGRFDAVMEAVGHMFNRIGPIKLADLWLLHTGHSYSSLALVFRSIMKKMVEDGKATRPHKTKYLIHKPYDKGPTTPRVRETNGQVTEDTYL